MATTGVDGKAVGNKAVGSKAIGSKAAGNKAGWLRDCATRFSSGIPQFAAWSGLPSSHLIEIIAQQDFDLIVLDGQHGLHDKASMMAGIAAAGLYRMPVLARIPIGEFATAAQLCDAGAAGVIAPMINSMDDAKLFASFVKFPPLGGRSWGPSRATALAGYGRGPDYFAAANDFTLSIAMIETREALAIADDILALPGIDGFLIGPNDLSISLLAGKGMDAMHSEVDAALDHCLAAAKRHKKIASAFAPSPARAAELAARGYNIVTVGTDGGHYTIGATKELVEAKGVAVTVAAPRTAY